MPVVGIWVIFREREKFQVQRPRRASTCVEPLELLRLRGTNHHEGVTADAGHMRLRHVEHRAMAMDASTALPPRFRTSRPACDASGWLVATMAWLARTTDRPVGTLENHSSGADD
jgi:hypothetical protein